MAEQSFGTSATRGRDGSGNAGRGSQVMPYSPEAEAAVLGSMMLDQQALEIALGRVEMEAFYAPRHRSVYEALKELHRRGMAVDFSTLATELRRVGRLEECGGVAGLTQLAEAVMSPANIEHYCTLVNDKFRARLLIRECEDLRQLALDQSTDTGTMLDMAEKKMFELGQQRESKEFRDISSLTLETLEEVEARAGSSGALTGVSTGYEKLDALTGGLQRSDLIILAARPSVGKTAFALNMACNIGVGLRELQIHPDKRRPVGIFSLEMSASQVNMRMLSTLSRIPMQQMRTGHLSRKDREDLQECAEKLHGAPVYIDDTAGLSLLELRAKARRLASQHPDLAVLFIDYLQLMRSGGKVENRQQEISEISRGLKALARELNIPIIALSQLSRLIEQRKGKSGKAKPMLSDLRESGAIEQDADVVMFIHRDRIYEEGVPRPEFEDAELIVGKQRNGPCDDVKLIFKGKTATYHNLLDQSGPSAVARAAGMLKDRQPF
jgi:replicative DNA helicase